jgi:hypothetical protein
VCTGEELVRGIRLCVTGDGERAGLGIRRPYVRFVLVLEVPSALSTKKLVQFWPDHNILHSMETVVEPPSPGATVIAVP